jgi:hypothetical protein
MAEFLRGSLVDGSDWDLHLSQAVVVYNSTMHRELEMSPSEYLLTRAHDMVSQPLLPALVKDTWQEGHPQFAPFPVGQLVLRKIVRSGNATIDKFKPRFDGPFKVTEVRSNGVTYIIERDLGDGRLLRKPAHHRQLKRFVDPPAYLANHPRFEQLVKGNVYQQDDQDDGSDSDDVCLGGFHGLCPSASDSSAELSSHEVVSDQGDKCSKVSRMKSSSSVASRSISNIEGDVNSYCQ